MVLMGSLLLITSQQSFCLVVEHQQCESTNTVTAAWFLHDPKYIKHIHSYVYGDMGYTGEKLISHHDNHIPIGIACRQLGTRTL
jgi:hypothetical protein